MAFVNQIIETVTVHLVKYTNSMFYISSMVKIEKSGNGTCQTFTLSYRNCVLTCFQMVLVNWCISKFQKQYGACNVDLVLLYFSQFFPRSKKRRSSVKQERPSANPQDRKCTPDEENTLWCCVLLLWWSVDHI